MKPFRFPLEKALLWRQQQLEVEELRMKQLSGTLAQIDRSRDELKAARSEAERDVREATALAAQDLAAFAAYRIHLESREQKLMQARSDAEQQVTAQRARVLVRSREAQLIQKLKTRRHAQWQSELNLELVNFAAEAYLNRWQRDSK